MLILEISHEYVNYITAMTKDYLQYISHLSQVYNRHFSAVYQVYLRNISDIYQAYLANLASIFQAYLRHMSDMGHIFFRHLSQILCISHASKCLYFDICLLFMDTGIFAAYAGSCLYNISTVIIYQLFSKSRHLKVGSGIKLCSVNFFVHSFF